MTPRNPGLQVGCPAYARVWIVHRQNRDTSGVMVLARNPDAHRAINNQFSDHQILQVYHALVCVNPEWDQLTVDLPLRPNGDRRHPTVVDHQRGKPSRTNLCVMERYRCNLPLKRIGMRFLQMKHTPSNHRLSSTAFNPELARPMISRKNDPIA